MGNAVRYAAHDPVGNCEAYVTEFDPEIISRAAASGIIFIAIDEEGNRSVVPASDVREPSRDDQQFTIVQPQYVDDRMAAVVDVFDALQAVMLSESMALAADGADETTDAAPRDPLEVFFEKIAALREIVKERDRR